MGCAFCGCSWRGGGRLALSCKRPVHGRRRGRADRLEDIMSEQRLWTSPVVCGRRPRRLVTGRGARRRTKGMRFPADPPTVEEIILVMREAGPGPYADRIRALIAILWRAGLRISEATESDLDPKTGSVLVRSGKGGGRTMVGMDDWAGSTSLDGPSTACGCRSVRCFASSPARPAAAAGRRQLAAVSCAGSPRRPVSGGGSRRTIKPTCSICRRRRASPSRLGDRRLEIGITRAAPIVTCRVCHRR
jgi:hypothetical protein